MLGSGFPIVQCLFKGRGSRELLTVKLLLLVMPAVSKNPGSQGT